MKNDLGSKTLSPQPQVLDVAFFLAQSPHDTPCCLAQIHGFIERGNVDLIPGRGLLAANPAAVLRTSDDL